MKALLNEFKYIIGYATLGDIENSVDIQFDENDLDNIHDYQVIEGVLKYNPIPKDVPVYMTKPVYDGNGWIDIATQDEIFKNNVSFYNTELEFASKAVAELKCDIISEEDFEDVKLYMQSIDPYAQNYKRIMKNKRPSIFDRYN